MLVNEDSLAKWMGQAIESPQNYFAVLAAVGFLIGQCLKVVRAGFGAAMDRETPWLLGFLALLASTMIVPSLVAVLAWVGISLILDFPGF